MALQLNNAEKFANEFVTAFLERGLGSMTKRETEVLALKLLIDDGAYAFPEDMFKACRELRLSKQKLRGYYQEVQLKYFQYDEKQAKEYFANLVSNGDFEVSGADKVVFTVRDPLLRQYLEEWVAANGGFTDSSFNKNLVVMNKRILEKVILYLNPDARKNPNAAIPKDLAKKLKVVSSGANVSVWKEFALEAVNGFFSDVGSASATVLGAVIRDFIGI